MDKETISIIFLVMTGIYILGCLASITSESAKEIVILGIKALGIMGVLILAAPPIGLIIFIISLIIKSSWNSQERGL